MKIFWISITENCNLNCRYCYQSFNKTRINLNKYTAQRVIEMINLSKPDVVQFFGGEPLINFDNIKKIVSNTKDSVKKYSLTTNLTILNSEMINFLNKYEFSLLISLDGIKESHDINRKDKFDNPTFEIVEKNLKNLLNKVNKNNLKIAKTLDINNYIYLSRDYFYFKKLGLDVEVNVDMNIDFSIINLDILKKEIEIIVEDIISEKENNINFWIIKSEYEFLKHLKSGKKIVYASRDSCYDKENMAIAISSEGNITPCHFFSETDDKQDFKKINIYNFNQIEEIESFTRDYFSKNNDFDYFSEKEILNISMNELVKKGCDKCKYYYLCANRIYYHNKNQCFYARYKYRKGQKNNKNNICIKKIIYESFEKVGIKNEL
ncbi:arylsulfatase regulator (Fe-S oxidoreductase) [Marinitoga piezophila KA3]|uniref:Arylsulfatase regulator (Fe-S oxidoreductase) n=1 Tax=Marinitoga piezophila (strain DSM 14283 / JCM 11233 / KA3) TaxID=443254 RepID=H2J7D4_MARPK|nr:MULTISPECIES: radical SAM protein [Marinitoga]AEX85326.1 arylsulfatase regulator (Fe-S oxidoreductase) [Marinitoga piezophila KA3]APT75810.1 hypothetical protein LN42_05000 [Marinitoga sp. 1137]